MTLKPDPQPDPQRSYIVEIPVEDFLAIVQLVEQATNRNSDVRIKGFYLKVLENLRAGWEANTNPGTRFPDKPIAS